MNSAGQPHTDMTADFGPARGGISRKRSRLEEAEAAVSPVPAKCPACGSPARAAVAACAGRSNRALFGLNARGPDNRQIRHRCAAHSRAACGRHVLPVQSGRLQRVFGVAGRGPLVGTTTVRPRAGLNKADRLRACRQRPDGSYSAHGVKPRVIFKLKRIRGGRLAN